MALRQENETEHHARVGQHRHRYSGQCHVYPFGQPDELGNHRQANRCALAFVFERIDMLPRHPGQLYEAICYFVFLIVGYVLYHKYPQKVGTGFFFGFCLTTIFTARFFIEYTKEVQEAWEASMLINMGQILSIPFILLGIYCMAGGKFCKKLAEKH